MSDSAGKSVRESTSLDERVLIPTNTLFILMIAFILAVAPHLYNVTTWLSFLCVGVVIWRYAMFIGVVRYPPTKLKTLLVIITVSLFYFTYRHQFSVESAVAFFVLASSLKLIEIRFAKDSYLFVFILLYLGATQFLFSQTFTTTLYQWLSIFVSLSVLFSLHKGLINISFSTRIKSFFKLLAITVPLVAVIFVFFPRVAPLWSIPLSTGKAVTGMTDEMTPGNIAELTQSSARAFRVDFSAELPDKSELYWRGLELDRLEGATWRSTEYMADRVLGRVDNGREINVRERETYDILLEPTNRRWAYALEGSVPATSNLTLNSEGFARLESNAIQPTHYKMGASADVSGKRSAVTLSAASRRKYLQLPTTGNNETRRFVAEVVSAQSSPEGIVNYLMSHFRSEPFFYTLRPPLTSDQFFDDFLFSTRRGFCSHYAGSLVYMLRLADIPSRVVVGYQGGELNSDEGYLIVHQYDAHAWVEVWLAERGWVRYDPTAMVSPERIEQGLEQAMLEEGSFLSDSALAFAKYNHIGAIRWMRLKMDAINYNWQKWVVGYDGNTQTRFLSRWLSDVSSQTLALWMSVIGGVLLFGGFLLLRTGKKHHETDKVVIEFNRFSRKLEKLGQRQGLKLGRVVGETPQHYVERLTTRFPALQDLLDYYIRSFYLIQYGREMNDLYKKRLLIRTLQKQANQIVAEVKQNMRKGVN